MLLAPGTVPGTEQTTRAAAPIVDMLWGNSLFDDNPLFSEKDSKTQRGFLSNPPLWPLMTVLLDVN